MNEIASRYAAGLYSIAFEQNKVNEWQLEVKAIYSLLKENAQFIDVLSSAFLTIEEKEKMIDKTFPGVRREIVNLLKLMVRNHRQRYIINALEAFNSLCNNYRGVKEGLLYSTTHLKESLISNISKKVSELEGQEVELYNVIDPSLIGGIKIVIDGHIYDRSIKSTLADMKLNLLK